MRAFGEPSPRSCGQDAACASRGMPHSADAFQVPVSFLFAISSSSIVGGKIEYQSNSQTLSCSRGMSLHGTAVKPGVGSPVAWSTTREDRAGRVFCWHQRVIRFRASRGLAKKFGPPRLIRRASCSYVTVSCLAAQPIKTRYALKAQAGSPGWNARTTPRLKTYSAPGTDANKRLRER